MTNDLDRKARELTTREAVEVLAAYQDWRNGTSSTQIPPAIISDAINTVIAALRLAVPEWRPIETAPLGETVVIGYLPASNSVIPVLHYERAGWQTQWDGYSCKPTHWQPLPAAPTLADEVKTNG